jgi:hypothetical protein
MRILKIIVNDKYLRFKVFKNWDNMKNNLQEILKNPYILESWKMNRYTYNHEV